MSLLPDPVSQGKNIVIAVIVVVVLGIIGYLSYTKSRLETKLAQAQTDIVALTDANNDWKTATDNANKAMKDAIDQAAAREAAAAKGVAEAKNLAKQYEARANEIMRSIPKGDDCVATKRLTDSYFGAKK